MNPDKEDPNNHAPAVTPDDDWDGLDVDQVFDSQLPPRRADSPRIPKMDVNISAFKASDSGRPVGGSTPNNDDAPLKSLVLVNVNAERTVPEKEDFQAALVMENLKQGDEIETSYQRLVPQGRFKQGERDDWGMNRQKGSPRWMLYAGAGVICLIALTIFLSMFASQKTVRDSKKAGLSQLKPANVKKESIQDLGAVGQLASRNNDTIRIYGQYAQAKSVDDALKSIYLSERNMQIVKEGWKATGAEIGWMPSSSSAWKTYQEGDLVYAELRGINYDFSKFSVFFRYENAELKIDWKATTGYGTADFTNLSLARVDGSEIRGWLAPSDFFTQELSEERYHSFILRSPKKGGSLWVYTEIGSDVDKDILALFAISPITGEQQTEARVTLNLDRGAEGILPRQWMIKSLTATNWLDQATP